MNPLHDAIVARLPATMRELAAHTGVDGPALWDAVDTLRKAFILVRQGPHGARVFSLPATAAPPIESRGEEAAVPVKKQRKRPVVLFWLPGWPTQEPNRRMVWRICWDGEPAAQRELKRIKKLLGKDAEWELAMMTPAEVRRLRVKGFSIVDFKDREKEAALREKADAAAS